MADSANRVSDEFPELFHYTTVPAFNGIYNRPQIFRATHYADLNDSSELRQFRLKVSEFIVPHIQKLFDLHMKRDTMFVMIVDGRGGINAVVDQEAVIQLDVLHRTVFGEGTFKDTFICSFCTHTPKSYEARHGLLSQWRGYGTDGGVAIVLDTKGIEDRMQYEKCVFAHSINHIGDVKYDNDNVGIREDFCTVFEYLPEILDAFYSKREPSYDKIFDHFVQGSTLVKHHAFREEKEIRIVVSPRPTNADSPLYNSALDSKQVKVIRYGRRGDSEVRYIELFGEASLPIKRVIVGPSRIQNFNYQQIREMVSSDIEVIKSGIPFLG